MPTYKRVRIKTPRYMVLHSFAVSCVEHELLTKPSCIMRHEWIDREDLNKKNVAVLGKSKLNKTHGEYCAIKF